VIVAAGLTPAWQQIMRFERFCPGEVNRAIDVAWCASGKVLNVGMALAQLGARSDTIALVGGATGQQIVREFAERSVPLSWVECQAPTRVCTTILDVSSGRATELVENAGRATGEELDAFRRTYRHRVASAQLAILTGSLPAGAPANFFRELVSDTPCRVILDIRGPELLAALEHEVFLVKPNREELARTVGRSLDGEAELVAAMCELNRNNAQWVVVTDGARPLWISSERGCFRITPPQVTAVNPIGSGDCLAAAAAWKILNGADPLEAVRFGAAAAAANVGQLLPARFNPDAVHALVGSIRVEPAD
jgi:1-phosphofructokinase family hexose kinase